MKVFYLATRITGAGGVAKVTAQKVNYWIAHWNYEVAICSSNETNATPFYSFDSRVRIFQYTLPTKTIAEVYAYYKSVATWIKEVKPDVVICSDNGLKAYLVPWFLSTNIPFVLEIHGDVDLMFQGFSGYWKQKIARFVVQQGIRRFDRLLFLDDKALQQWEHPNKTVIPNCVEGVSIQDIQRKPYTAIAVGRIAREKRYDILLKSWQIVKQQFTDATLCIYGEVEDVGYYDELLKNACDGVTFQGVTAAISTEIASSMVLVHPSVSEGFGMVLYEAVAVQTPIVAYDTLRGASFLEDIVFWVPEGDIAGFANRIVAAFNGVLWSETHKKELPEELRPDVVMQQWASFFASFRL